MSRHRQDICPECAGIKDVRSIRCDDCRTDPIKRIWRTTVSEGTCLVWLGDKTRDGYGRFVVEGQRHFVHRWLYEFLVERVSEGLTLDHLCRNPSCVNPSHLEPVTLRDNILRGTSPAALAYQRNRCKRGHEFTEENTYSKRLTSGQRVRGCRACHRLIQRNYLERKARS
jgi:hypothetical protein